MPTLLQAIEEFNTACPTYSLALSQTEKNAIEEIYANKKEDINPTLRNLYYENLKLAVNSVFTSAGGDLREAALINMQKFATYKAFHATKDVKQTETTDDAIKALKKYNRWQTAEYNAAVARCRTAKQWDKFQEHADILPNIRWVPSRSVKVREEHTKFYNRIWAKDDPFWTLHQPGNCYGCKCDWVETAEEATEKKNKTTNDVKDKYKESNAPGLNSNPGDQGEIFTPSHSYMRKAKGEEKLIRRIAEEEIHYEGIRISLMADSSEMYDNIRTGIILANGGEDVLIRPDFNEKHVGFAHKMKNPEYAINGIVADAKRIESIKGISGGFSSAINQGCEAVIIDFDKHNVSIDADEVAKMISNRYVDFNTRTIRLCYLVKNGKYLTINSDIFDRHPNNDRISKEARVRLIKKKIKEALE